MLTHTIYSQIYSFKKLVHTFHNHESQIFHIFSRMLKRAARAVSCPLNSQLHCFELQKIDIPVEEKKD